MNFFSSKFKIGILGGGQLGKMLLFNSKRYDLHTKVMDSNKNAPCSNIADEFIVGNLNDFNDVITFGKLVDIITIEIENVNTEALEYLEKIGKKVYPPSRAIKIIQNKCEQKIFYKSNDLPSATFTNYSSLANLKEDLKKERIEFPFVWKSAKFGYDGKGVKIINNSDDLNSISDGLCLAEEKISIKKEISVIVSRNVDGKMECFPVVEMEFNDDSNLVEYVICPADISKKIAARAYKIAKNISEKLEMVGLLAVELFITNDNKILINEVAPRPHNSGHHTIECCITSQFDQHIRSILNLNPGKTDIIVPGIMVNLVGENKIEGDALYKNINHIFDFPGVNIHIYGKKKSRLNRKMGHITIINKEISKAIEIAKKIKEKVKVTS